jgi:hypothetical protein
VSGVNLACPICEALSVAAPLNGEDWTGPAGQVVAVAAGKCMECGSRVLVDPSRRGVEIMAGRIAAASISRPGYPVTYRRPGTDGIPDVLAPLDASEGTMG